MSQGRPLLPLGARSAGLAAMPVLVPRGSSPRAGTQFMTLSQLSPLLWLYRQPVTALFACPHFRCDLAQQHEFLLEVPPCCQQILCFGLGPQDVGCTLTSVKQTGTLGQACPSPTCGVSSILAQSPVDGPLSPVPQNFTLMNKS